MKLPVRRWRMGVIVENMTMSPSVLLDRWLGFRLLSCILNVLVCQELNVDRGDTFTPK